MKNGNVNGFPLLHDGMSQDAPTLEFKRAHRTSAAAGWRRTLPINAYGAQNPAEFFAVLERIFLFDLPWLVMMNGRRCTRWLVQFTAVIRWHGWKAESASRQQWLLATAGRPGCKPVPARLAARRPKSARTTENSRQTGGDCAPLLTAGVAAAAASVPPTHLPSPR